MSLTDEQSAIIQASFGEVMCVTAYAGSGKTYTLQQFAKERPAQRMLYLAFNKAMATEAAEKGRCTHDTLSRVQGLRTPLRQQVRRSQGA